MQQTIKISELQIRKDIDVFSLADFAEIEKGNTMKINIDRDFQSILYHYKNLCKFIFPHEFMPILVDDDYTIIDGIHRLAAIAYYNYKHPRKQITTIPITIITE